MNLPAEESEPVFRFEQYCCDRADVRDATSASRMIVEPRDHLEPGRRGHIVSIVGIES